jgi:hypothetical protein
MAMDRAPVEGIEPEYELRGSGEPVVLIHWGVASAFAEPLVDEPALADYRLLSYHRAGFGASSRIDGPLMADHARHCRRRGCPGPLSRRSPRRTRSSGRSSRRSSSGRSARTMRVASRCPCSSCWGRTRRRPSRSGASCCSRGSRTPSRATSPTRGTSCTSSTRPPSPRRWQGSSRDTRSPLSRPQACRLRATGTSSN